MKRLYLLTVVLVSVTLPARSQTAGETSQGVVAPTVPAPVASPTDLTNQLRAAWDQLRAADVERARLEAKLREALASQPAAMDPRELARAEERIRALQKDNDLLRTALDQAKSSPPANTAELERLRRELAETRRKLQIQADAAVLLLAETNTKLAQQSSLAAALTLERDDLKRRIELAGTGASPGTSRLAAENADLRKQLADAKAAPKPAARNQELGRHLEQTQAKLAAVTADQTALGLEKTTLEQRLRQALQQVADANKSAAAATAASAAQAKRVKELERERDDLQRVLKSVNQELAKGTGKAPSKKLQVLNDEMLALRAKLDVYEAKAVPYTAEELALFKKPEPALVAADAKAERKVARSRPVAMATLVAEGDRQFKSAQYEKAEQSYQQVVEKDNKDLRTLCNLATTQAAENHLDEAEQTIQKALSIAPNDPASLGVLGYVKYSQAKYDEALEVLGRAAKLKPQDPGLQNLIGTALIQKGMRGQAETAFRKALQISPSFADAHRNLASVYLTQQPPLKELARWHYQKALAAGHPRVPEIESKLEETKPAAAEK